MLKAMVATANLNKLGRPEYAKYGFVPGDLENESVSKTLEYAYDDWCIAMFAKAIGDKRVYEEYIRRAQSYKNIMDPNGFMRGRMNGGFATPFNPREVNNFYTEANCWQYTTYIPHDFDTYVELMGGPGQTEIFLDRLFNSSSEMAGREQADITGVIGQYAHGNEPSHHAAYLYNYVGKPAKTQKLVKRILTELYSSKPDGLCGNEDCGQMSAWYVFSAMGFYPVCPGSDQYIIGYPLFDKVVMRLENGKTLTVTKDNDKPYIQSATLNGKPLNRTYLLYKDIADGGELSFVMGDQPSRTWGWGGNSEPYSRIDPAVSIVPVPVFATDKVSFRDQMLVSISTPHVVDHSKKYPGEPKVEKQEVSRETVSSNRLVAVPVDNVEYSIYYTTDGSTPTPKNGKLYKEPFTVDKDVTIKAVAVDSRGTSSRTAEAHYVRYTRDKDLTYVHQPDPQYFAGGDEGLIDNQRGKVNYRIGGWQGFTTDCEVIVDLRTSKKISEVGAGVLEEQRAWIFYPRAFEVYVSNDGKEYTLYDKTTLPIGRTEGAHIQDLKVTGNAKARYVKIIIKNYGKMPSWHISAGEQAWLFVDEIWVK
jgi:hypothetical protein